MSETIASRIDPIMRENERKCLLKPANGELRKKAIEEGGNIFCGACRARFCRSDNVLAESDDDSREMPCAHQFRS